MPNFDEGSDEKSIYEASYSTFDPSSHSSLSTLRSPWSSNDIYRSTYPTSNQRDPLRSTLGRSKVTKASSSYSAQHYIDPKARGHGQHLDHYQDHDRDPDHDHDHDHAPLYPHSPYDDGSQFHHHYPAVPPHPFNKSQLRYRSSINRVPSLFDRIKAALETPSEPSNPSYSTSPPQPSFPPQSPMYSPISPIRFPHSPQVHPPISARFVNHRSEVVQRAYSGQCSEMKESFARLQQIDSGKVEYRTIAFSTHLTVSRWEPPITTTTTTPNSPSDPSVEQHAQQQKPKQDPARLVSLANYIRHIVSLTSGIPSTPAQAQAQAQSQAQMHTKKEEQKKTTPPSSHASSGPGPIKSDRGHAHRFSPHYHHTRRAGPQSRHFNRLDSESGAERYSQHSAEGPYDSSSEPLDDGPRYSSIEYQHPRRQSLSSPTQATPPHQDSLSSPLLRVLYPNLTLTLALIYVDRLKAKYPEAKGEAGCSHRLFLIAFIIAAKYRCSVEFSPPTSDDSRASHEHEYQLEHSVEARWNAEMVFSNHAWVRLLNLGSFHRSIPPSTAPASSSLTSADPRASDNRSMDEDRSGTSMQRSTPALSQPSPSSIQTSQDMSMSIPNPDETSNPRAQLQSVTPATPGTLTPAGAILQVEDLDRMESEFLTFLKGDLATMSHDLETCWNLLVGKTQ
ncbi:MAG: hypothetical protein BYD32DRAFT_407713 [Podila humilis]|nr:MAG: hypothetical protein BYD32DRAFT_407713 [Podila humilis]